MGKPYLSIEVDKPASDKEGAPRRNYKARKEAWTTPPGKPHVTTIYELFKEGVKEFPTKRSMGQRKFIKLHNETKEITKRVDGEEVKVKKQWQFYEMGAYSFLTFEQVDKLVLQIASGLVHLGVKPGSDRISIYCRTSQEWMQTAVAAASQSVTIVTAYDTLGIEGLRSSLNETGAVAIVTDKDNFGTLAKTLAETPSIQLVVYRDTDGELNDKETKALDELKSKVKVVSFTELLEIGSKNPAKPHPPKPTDVACIMYTSGSTGKPKGVILNHSTVIAGVTGAVGNISRDFVGPTDVFLNILPLAHIFEFTAELSTFYWGACLGYGNPKTVSDASMKNSKSDIRELRPTIMAAVPAVWEAVRKGVMAKVEKKPAFAQKVFWTAFHFKMRMKGWGLPAPGVDSLVFAQIREATGGKLRYVMNGGAALPRSTRVFLDLCIAPCIMGYGLTETNAMCALMAPEHIEFESTGELVPAVTVKLVDVPDFGYYSKNGQGEILIKGGPVSPGYFNNEEETKAAYTEDGWFMTGDIGEWSSNGALQIIDRKKNLVKTLNGEYIAIERLESLYRGNKYVQNICVFADDQHVKPIAVVVVAEPALKELVASMDIQYQEGIASHNKKVAKAILESIQATGKESDLKPVEIIAALAFSEEEWTPQNGFVTSAQKVQRRAIKEANKAGIEKAFASSG